MANVEKLRRNLEAHGFTTSFFDTAAQAADYLCGQIHGCSVGIGGSVTIDSLGIYERLSADNRVFWHWKDADEDSGRRAAQEAEVYLCSVNGAAETGELVNIDRIGNRLAATIYAKEKVYIVIGTNKIEETLEKAVYRARNVASPLNARRLKRDTPCARSAELKCFDCSHPQRICGALLILYRRMLGVKECEVVVIDEKLGY